MRQKSKKLFEEELKNNGAMVQDKDGTFRLMEWRDIVLLKRSISGSASRMIDLLRREGIPAYAEEKSGYFSAMEVQFVLSLLQIIDNPEQDLPMAIVLQSPLIGMDANALGRLRLPVGEDSLWRAMKGLLDPSRASHRYLIRHCQYILEKCVSDKIANNTTCKDTDTTRKYKTMVDYKLTNARCTRTVKTNTC